MAVKEIPNGHHVIRHCRKRLIDTSDPDSPMPFPEAFNLRNEVKETYLSASYYEYFTGSHDDRLLAACTAMRSSFPKIKGQDSLVMLSAQEIRTSGDSVEISLRVVHQPKPGRKDYAGIRGLPTVPNQRLNGLLATACVRDVVRIDVLEA